MASFNFVSIEVVSLLVIFLYLLFSYWSALLDIRSLAFTLIKIDDWAPHLHLLRQHSFVHCALLLQPEPSQPWYKSVVFPQGCHVFLLCLDSSHIVERVSFVRLFASWKCHQMCHKGESTRCLFARKAKSSFAKIQGVQGSPRISRLEVWLCTLLGATFYFSHHSGKTC